MKTELEKEILKKCGWDNKQIDFQGVMVHKISTEQNKSIAHLVTRVNEVELMIELSVPDSQGEKMKMVFDRKTQLISLDKSDVEINDEKSMQSFLLVVQSSINNTKGVFMATRKDQVTNKHTI